MEEIIEEIGDCGTSYIFATGMIVLFAGMLNLIPYI